MKASIVCWGGPDLHTEVDVQSDDAKSLFIKDETTDYCRVFMTLAQMQTLRDQLTAALKPDLVKSVQA